MKRKKKPKKPRLEFFNIRVSPEEKRTIVACARKFSKGNISGWFRTAAINYEPPKLRLGE